jgi:hypothetical protein
MYVKRPLFLSDFKEISIFSTDFGKILKCKFHKNLSSASRVVPCGEANRWTDSCDEANSRFSQFFERT